jgi:hypothetical protein
MTWVAWRQFRTQALVTIGLTAALATLVLVSGLHLREVYSSLGGARCRAQHGCQELFGQETAPAALLGPALLALPALLGMFWGAPLLARELESGTYRLAWTQGVTRRRWLLVKIGLLGLAALAVAGLASWLVSWWYAPLDAVNLDRLEPGVFTARGIVAIGYAGFAFALGVGAGALARRTLPAMAATLFGFLAARLLFTYLVRPNLLSTRHALIPLAQGASVGFFAGPSGTRVFSGAPALPNAWVLSSTLVNRAGKTVGNAQLHGLLLRACPTLARGLPPYPGAGSALQPCTHALSQQLRLLVAYQPSSHYWPLQGLETGIFLAAALALVGATVWLIEQATARRPAAARRLPARAARG